VELPWIGRSASMVAWLPFDNPTKWNRICDRDARMPLRCKGKPIGA
jgi:hypothetical protein